MKTDIHAFIFIQIDQCLRDKTINRMKALRTAAADTEQRTVWKQCKKETVGPHANHLNHIFSYEKAVHTTNTYGTFIWREITVQVPWIVGNKRIR